MDKASDQHLLKTSSSFLELGESIYRKGQNHLQLLRRLKDFKVSRALLRYCGGLCNVLRHRVLGEWSHGQAQGEAGPTCEESQLSSVLSCPLDSIQEVAVETLAKLTSILDDTSHPLHHTVEARRASSAQDCCTLGVRRSAPCRT